LGELLVQAGLLTDEQLKAALREHKKSGLRLGQYLTKTNLCRESDVVELISRQLKIDRYSPQQHPLSLNMAERLPLDVAQKCNAVPLQQHGHVLVVAMVDPLDIDALDTLEFATNSEVEPLICTEQEYNQLFSAIYGMFTNLDGVIESLGELHTAAASQSDAAERDVAVDELANQADLAPVIRLVNSILAQAVREGASDVHISPEKDSVQVRFRIDGKLREAPAPPRSVAPAVVSRIKILGNMDIAVTRVPQDGRFTMHLDNREINVRVSSIPTIYGENMVLRLLDMSGRDYTLDMLGMQQNDHQTIEGAIHKPYGMILSTGPTGSGKSTSLYAILKSINRPDINIITLEDPVEYRIRGIRQVQLNRKAGMTFASGLRSILRQDPDVVMVGEIRDAETAAIAVQAALTGHLVLSTLHTNDAAHRHGHRAVSGVFGAAGLVRAAAGAPGVHQLRGTIRPAARRPGRLRPCAGHAGGHVPQGARLPPLRPHRVPGAYGGIRNPAHDPADPGTGDTTQFHAGHCRGGHQHRPHAHPEAGRGAEDFARHHYR
jgi:type IV pilus assembly protein PilB